MKEHIPIYDLRNSIWLQGGEVKSMLWVQVIEFSTQLLRQVMVRGVLEVTGSMRMVELKVLVQLNLVMTYLAKCKTHGGKMVSIGTTVKILQRNKGNELSKVF